jgi:hypothetical protein
VILKAQEAIKTNDELIKFCKNEIKEALKNDL